MELIRYFEASKPGTFPFAAAIGAAVFETEAVILDCFVLVENRDPFFWLKRREFPQTAMPQAIVEEMMIEIGRIHRTMARAAERHSCLPAHADPNATPALNDMPDGFLRTLWGKRIFKPHLRWIGLHTISGILRCRISDLESSDREIRTERTDREPT